MFHDFSNNDDFPRMSEHARPVMVWRVGANGRLKASWTVGKADGVPEESNVIPFMGDGIFPFAGLQARARLSRR